MPISHEIKSQLARLLATEDIIVEHRQVDTAQFNVSTRVLTLPLWDRASNSIYDLLVGHEVGHALFTPDVDPPKDVPHSIFNIVEDARIEKLMKRRYPGLSKSFFKGYKDLSDQDFFCLEGENIDEMSLPDRVNLYFKIGNHIDINFDNYLEMPIVRMIAGCEDFKDAIVAAKALYNLCKSGNNSANKMPQPPGESPSDENEDGDSIDNPMGGISSADGDQSNENSDNSKGTGGGDFDDLSTHTVDSLEEKLKDLTNQYSRDNIYVEIPDINLNTVVVPNSDIHAECDRVSRACQDAIDSYCSENNSYDIFETVDASFYAFKKSSAKEVSYLVKEFECKKAADSYARSSVARTGVLDCSKLHTYKYSEDLFKKVTTIPDGKNHGLIFVLDWSGSMANVLLDTIKQLYNLIWFCKKVSIPFEVYAFTNEWNRISYSEEYGRYIPMDMIPHYEKEEGLICVEDSFSMMNLLTSKVGAKELQKQMINIWRVAKHVSNSASGYRIPEKLTLSGTPLNEAIITLHKILPKFIRDTGVQKVQCIILTDGEAGSLVRHVNVNRPWEDQEFLGTRRLPLDHSYLRDRKTGTTRLLGPYYNDFTDTLLKNLKDNFTDVNLIGIRVLIPRDANSFIRQYYSHGSDPYLKINEEWQKSRSFCITRSGYDAYFGMASTTLSQDSDFTVNDGATKGQIKSAFVKSFKSKKLNKKVLGEFISLIS